MWRPFLFLLPSRLREGDLLSPVRVQKLGDIIQHDVL